LTNGTGLESNQVTSTPIFVVDEAISQIYKYLSQFHSQSMPRYLYHLKNNGRTDQIINSQIYLQKQRERMDKSAEYRLDVKVASQYNS
jgi:hypothetical protein